jgi:hypothetical protein
VLFFCGLHQPSDAKMIRRAFISVNRLWNRRSDIHAKGEWIMDSGAFTTIAKHGGYPEPVSVYAAECRRWASSPGLLAVVSQDYMCEPMMLAKTGLTIADHQRLTIERYDALLAENVGVYAMPVLQGFEPSAYVSHVRQYGDRLGPGAWVGVGSICKRNGNPSAIVAVLSAILAERPDLRLHGFGLKKTSLQISTIVDALYSADSMAWSFAARISGRGGNDWRDAERFARGIETMPLQTEFALTGAPHE